MGSKSLISRRGPQGGAAWGCNKLYKCETKSTPLCLKLNVELLVAMDTAQPSSLPGPGAALCAAGMVPSKVGHSPKPLQSPHTTLPTGDQGGEAVCWEHKEHCCGAWTRGLDSFSLRRHRTGTVQREKQGKRGRGNGERQ